jgi:hypothetical protein
VQQYCDPFPEGALPQLGMHPDVQKPYPPHRFCSPSTASVRHAQVLWIRHRWHTGKGGRGMRCGGRDHPMTTLFTSATPRARRGHERARGVMAMASVLLSNYLRHPTSCPYLSSRHLFALTKKVGRASLPPGPPFSISEATTPPVTPSPCHLVIPRVNPPAPSPD